MSRGSGWTDPRTGCVSPMESGQEGRLYVEVRSIQELYATGKNWGKFGFM